MPWFICIGLKGISESFMTQNNICVLRTMHRSWSNILASFSNVINPISHCSLHMEKGEKWEKLFPLPNSTQGPLSPFSARPQSWSIDLNKTLTSYLIAQCHISRSPLFPWKCLPEETSGCPKNWLFQQTGPCLLSPRSLFQSVPVSKVRCISQAPTYPSSFLDWESPFATLPSLSFSY